jgi:hypothetical protein
MERGQDEKEEKLRVVTLIGSVVLSTSPRYCLGGL